MERLYFIATDAGGGIHRLRDVIGGSFSTDEHGFKSATLQHSRDFRFGWDDLGLNYDLLIGVRGNVAWNGRMEGNEAQPSGGYGSVGSSGNGYYASTRDLLFTGTVSTSATPEAMIASFLNSVYLPQLSTATTGLLVTGVTGAKYLTGNNGTDSEYVGDIIETICGFGYSPGGTPDPTKKVAPAVWEDRLLTTTAISTSGTAADYIVRKKNVNIGGLRRSLSNIVNRVVVRYKDLSGTFTVTPFNDSASQTAMSNYLGGAAVPYVRVELLDWTSQGNLDPTVVSNRANAILNDLKQVKVDTDSIEIKKDYVVFSVAENQEIPNWKVRAGKWLQIPDRFPRGTSTGSGTAAGDAGLSNYYYISETSYDCFSGVLTLTPENSSSLADFIS